jgi:hypothetical protein
VPSTGATTRSERCAAALESAKPKAVESAAIESPAATAKSASPTAAVSGRPTSASGMIVTAALPPSPWSVPIPNASSGGARPARMAAVPQLVAPPERQQPHREHDDQRADRGLSRVLHWRGQIDAREDDRQPDREQDRAVPGAPRRAERRGSMATVLAARREQVPDRDQVVGIGRVAEAEQDRDRQDQRNRRRAREGGYERMVDPRQRLLLVRPRSMRASSGGRGTAGIRAAH